MVYGYIRVSTGSQDPNNQKYEILKYVNSSSVHNDKITFVEETVSGAKDWKKRNLGDLINSMNSDDILLVSEVSRLGRKLLDIFEIFKIIITDKKAKIIIIKSNISLSDDLTSKVFLFAHSIGAEFERELNIQRTKEALQAKKASGVKLGRPIGSRSSKLEKYAIAIAEDRKLGASYKYIANKYKVTEGAVRYFCNTRVINK